MRLVNGGDEKGPLILPTLNSREMSRFNTLGKSYADFKLSPIQNDRSPVYCSLKPYIKPDIRLLALLSLYPVKYLLNGSIRNGVGRVLVCVLRG